MTTTIFFPSIIENVCQVTAFFQGPQGRSAGPFGTVFLSTSHPPEPKNAGHGEQLRQSVSSQGRDARVRDSSSLRAGKGGADAGAAAVLTAHPARELAAHGGRAHGQGRRHPHAVRLGGAGRAVEGDR